GLWHGALRSHNRGAPATGSVAVLGDEDRCGPDRPVVLPLVRDTGQPFAAVQHLRPATVCAGDHPDGYLPDREWRAENQTRIRASNPRLHLRRRYSDG